MVPSTYIKGYGVSKTEYTNIKTSGWSTAQISSKSLYGKNCASVVGVYGPEATMTRKGNCASSTSMAVSFLYNMECFVSGIGAGVHYYIYYITVHNTVKYIPGKFFSPPSVDPFHCKYLPLPISNTYITNT